MVMVYGLWFMVYDLWLRAQGSRSRGVGLEYRVEDRQRGVCIAERLSIAERRLGPRHQYRLRGSILRALLPRRCPPSLRGSGLPPQCTQLGLQLSDAVLEVRNLYIIDLLISFRKSTLPHIRRLNISISNSKQ